MKNIEMSPYLKYSLYIIEVILSAVAIGYTVVIMWLGITGEPSLVSAYIHNHWLTHFTLMMVVVPSIITIIGTRLGGFRWTKFRLLNTMILVVGMLFLSIDTFLTLGAGNIAWVSFVGMAATAAVCNVNVKVDSGGGH